MGEYFYQQVYWLSPNLLADLLTFTANLLADLLTIKKSVGRKVGYFCWQIYWLSLNLPAYLLTINKSSSRNGGISASRFTDSPNLLADLLTFTPNLPADLLSVTEYASRNWGVFLLADLLNLTKSADRNVRVSISAGRLTDSHKIYWPIYWLPPNLPAEM